MSELVYCVVYVNVKLVCNGEDDELELFDVSMV